jgi:hypothetical protein
MPRVRRVDAGHVQSALLLEVEDIMRAQSGIGTGRRLLSAIAIAVFVAACGGGGDDGGGGSVDITDDPAPPMPTSINYEMRTKDAAPLAFSIDVISVSYPLLQFGGTWNRTADAWTMTGYSGVNSGAQLFGNFAIQSVDPLQFSADDTPTAGKLEFTTPAGNSFFPGERVQVTVGVNAVVTYNQQTNTYDWDTFFMLWPDTTQHPSQRLASFGTTVSGLAADRGKMVLDLMAAINANDLKISGVDGYVTACSTPPGAAAGTRRIALANPDGVFNPGDAVVVTYTNCWVDDPTDSIDLLWNGKITMSGYIENRSPFSTGFDEIRFDGLAENETETVGSTVNIVQPPIVTNGTLTLFIKP